MELIEKNWAWISSNLWVAITLAIILLVLGWSAATLFYRERIEILKEKISHKSLEKSDDNFKYPQSGRYGKNILSNSVLSIDKNEEVALRAHIPNNSILLVEIKGPPPTHLGDTESSWHMSLSKKSNWTSSTYEPENGGRQEFTAEAGLADMEIVFTRCGVVNVTVYEGNNKTAKWGKVLNVRET